MANDRWSASSNFCASHMEVPDWGGAPEEDYPLLLASSSPPASDKARKKAKRKQKQQQDLAKQLIQEPVHLISTRLPSDKAVLRKGPEQQNSQTPQVETTHRDQQDKSVDPVASSLDQKRLVGGQAAKSKKRARGCSSTLETGNGSSNGFSTSGAAQPAIPAIAAKWRSFKALTALQPHGSFKPVLHGQQFRKAGQKLDLAVTADTKQQIEAASELQHTSVAQPKAKKAKKASAVSGDSNIIAVNLSTGSKQDPLVSATEAGENAAVKCKQKKLGRNARLRLKRQAYRQQALSTLDSQVQPVGEVTLAKMSGKAAAARHVGLTATRREQPGGLVQKVLGGGRQMAASATKLEAGAVEQRQRHAAPALPSVQSPELKDSKPAGKVQKKGLLEQMRSKLCGGRFRMLNEELYTSAGQHAFRMMQGQPELYQQYHEGFREQTQHWPVQPVDLAITWLQKQSPAWVVADFGCGDARLGSSVPQKVHGLDLVATAPGVTACNMAHTPLGDASIDAAVFCLALMGTDYGSFIQEAFRVLRPSGVLWIAEVRSRFVSGNESLDAFAPFVEALKQQGLTVTQQDSSNKMFVVFQARKVAERCVVAAQWPKLKPCLYKRR